MRGDGYGDEDDWVFPCSTAGLMIVVGAIYWLLTK
jgi:hypothetical protein